MGELDVATDIHRGMKIGRYQVLTQLTMGGMAELFLGYTAGPGGFRKYVVIKRILPDAKNNDQFVKMFLDEARVTAAFSHPNIAQVFELGTDVEDLYLAMEFISGQNLNQVTAVCAKKRAVMPIGFSAAVAHDIALALHYAHHFTDPAGAALTVIHRDVAQKNIMVTYDGAVKLLDFGIAKARGSLGRTHAGTVKGTTGYMSPEQVRGDELDGRSDVFGLGVVLFEMITGRRLFSADSEIEEMKMILTAPIPRPSSLVSVIPEPLSDIVMRALAREKADRWPSGKDMAKALATQCQGLLYDQEARSVFMKEHFADQMSATAALLQSVTDSSAKHMVLAKAVKAIRGDGGAMSNAQRMSKEEVKIARAKPRKKEKGKTSDTDAELASLQAKAEVMGAQSAGSAPATNPSARSGLSLAVPAILLAGMLMLGFALYKVAFTGGPPPPLDAPFYDKPVPIPHDTSQDTASPPQPQAGGKDPQPPPGKEPDTTGKPKAPAVHTGQVTLITFPDATVFRGRQELGKTPLFNATLPVGTHMLTLIGADGVKHVLSVPVHDGKNVPMKVKLDELPVR
jgi:eukaryotic-like serine/threonine-protein kinase